MEILSQVVTCPLDNQTVCRCIYQGRLRKASKSTQRSLPDLSQSQSQTVAAGVVIEQVGLLPGCPIKSRGK